jgi:hypothetical protein
MAQAATTVFIGCSSTDYATHAAKHVNNIINRRYALVSQNPRLSNLSRRAFRAAPPFRFSHPEPHSPLHQRQPQDIQSTYHAHTSVRKMDASPPVRRSPRLVQKELELLRNNHRDLYHMSHLQKTAILLALGSMFAGSLLRSASPPGVSSDEQAQTTPWDASRIRGGLEDYLSSAIGAMVIASVRINGLVMQTTFSTPKPTTEQESSSTLFWSVLFLLAFGCCLVVATTTSSPRVQPPRVSASMSPRNLSRTPLRTPPRSPQQSRQRASPPCSKPPRSHHRTTPPRTRTRQQASTTTPHRTRHQEPSNPPSSAYRSLSQQADLGSMVLRSGTPLRA